jgi:arylsulfatase A-like enzyme
LPGVLKRNGYRVPVLSRFVNIPNYWHLGFDTVDKEQFSEEEGEDLLELLESCKKEKFFIWYHYHGLHLPYNPPSPYDRIFQENIANEISIYPEMISMVKKKSVIKHGSITFNDGDKKTIVALYDGQLRQLDDYVGRLIGKMKDWGILDNTIIIVTADHGEELFEHGFIGHASTSLNAKLYDEIIRIPLLFWWPKNLQQGTVDELVQQIDIMPTILDILGLPVPEGLQGVSLLPLIEGKPIDNSRTVPVCFERGMVFCETNLGGYQSTKEMEEIKLRCIRTKDWKLIYRCTPLHGLNGGRLNNEIYELYNLKTDPGEERNIVERNPDVAKELKKKLFQWIETVTSLGNVSLR